jgi:hypothetical protein
VSIHIAGAPATLTFRQTPEAAAQRGTVLVYHGFGGDKSKLAPLSDVLADAGFLAQVSGTPARRRSGTRRIAGSRTGSSGGWFTTPAQADHASPTTWPARAGHWADQKLSPPHKPGRPLG